MITFKSQTLLLVFLSVLYTLLLNYPKGNDETFTIYIVFHLCSKKNAFLYCQHSSCLSQGHIGTRVKQRIVKDIKTNVSPSSPRLIFLYFFFSIFCVYFLSSKAFYCMTLVQLSKLENLILIHYFPIYIQVSLVPVMSFIAFFLSHAFCCHVSLASFNLKLLSAFAFEFVFEDYSPLILQNVHQFIFVCCVLMIQLKLCTFGS